MRHRPPRGRRGTQLLRRRLEPRFPRTTAIVSLYDDSAKEVKGITAVWHASAPLLPRPPTAADRSHPHVLLAFPPEALCGKACAWARVEARLAELREPFATECEGWAGRQDSFQDFSAILREWGDVMTEAATRGWGLLVGLP